ncbi:hypothetical protein Bhyg_11252 [Pseudolycoriella hygida]|uniref:Uncharacterized protein n=1 Tax=Pseudolycoriella hygida TaxID=35572 RepID=A0A9Q0MUZ2_9DIPT|nr:hypothetical protein Bhyg_11252 [Pseudolycoriella hygida]
MIVYLKVFTIYCFVGSFIMCGAYDETILSLSKMLGLPHGTENDIILHREKRQGGGGIIPFRPLFVYRQQQKEQQERWKQEEAKKKQKQQFLEYQQNLEAIKQSQRYQSRPVAQYNSYSYPTTQYSSYYNYPSSYYASYSYPSYYEQYQSYPVIRRRPTSNYYQGYYDGYEYTDF